MKSCEDTLILTVEDDTGTRKIIERILMSSGYRHIGANSGPESKDPWAACVPVIILIALAEKRDRSWGVALPLPAISPTADSVIWNRRRNHNGRD
jgi:DNA-binding NtrC family response regulator